jgi:peroxiredoxin
MNNAPYAIRPPAFSPGEAFHPASQVTRPQVGGISPNVLYAGRMMVLAPGAKAPAIPGIDFGSGPQALFFYKVTCPVCQMAAPKAQAFEQAYPGRIVGIGEDPPGKLAAFRDQFGMTFPSVVDAPPYGVSNAYGIRVVPTTFLVDADGTILETVESWDREGLNRISARLAELVQTEPALISDPSDGLPPFRPG